jgi:hypothetical protein
MNSSKPILRVILVLAILQFVAVASDLPPAISTVAIQDRVIQVNGKPFFPIMSWLQDATNFQLVKECGMNTTAGYWRGSGGTKDVAAYLELVAKAGLYGVLPFDERLKNKPALLGYIHDDEPDLSRQVSDAQVEPAKTLRINPKTPLWKLLDGDLNSWSVLDPLAGASFTIRLRQPATIAEFAVAVTISQGLATPNEVVFEAGGKELLKASVAAKKGRQKFRLPQPATIQELTVKVVSVTAGEQEWGSLGEVEGFDLQGKNLLLSPPRQVPRAEPEITQRHYADLKKADSDRPVFMTLTGNFLPFFKKWPEAQRARMYPQYVKAADVVGYDIYPIYGWNKPEWLHLGHDATEMLVQMAGTRPVYAWIETSKGSQWTGPLENQKDVTGDHIRAEVWMSICRGATAIGYFTHVWKPAYSQFGVPADNRRALRQINDQISRLIPAILGQPATQATSIAADDQVKLDLRVRQTGEGLYLFAVNYDEKLKPATTTIKVEGLAAGTSVVVVDENRKLTSVAGAFTDTFAPLAVHIYQIR